MRGDHEHLTPNNCIARWWLTNMQAGCGRNPIAHSEVEAGNQKDDPCRRSDRRLSRYSYHGWQEGPDGDETGIVCRCSPGLRFVDRDQL